MYKNRGYKLIGKGNALVSEVIKGYKILFCVKIYYFVHC